MPSGPLYRIGAPIAATARTRCDECKQPTSNLWLSNGRSLCTSCRKKQPAPSVDLTQPPAA